MKKILFFAICVMALVFAGCGHEEPATSNKVETGAVTEITCSTALFHGTVNVDISTYNDVEFGIMIAESKEELNAREGDMFDAKVLIGKEFKLEIGNLSPSTSYYYCAWLLLNNTQYEFGSIKDFTTLDKIAIEAVDLGLSVKWATCNVGASKPEDYGEYFAWGETTTKSTYDWSTYKWCNGSYDTQTKYCTDSSYGTVDNKTVLDKEDDAAAVNWGGAWRMPTKEEQDELRNNCTWTWITQNGVNGYTVTGPNGNSIFLPAAGYRDDSSLIGAGSYGIYWSSSLNTYYTSDAWYVYFYPSSVYRYYDYRYYGHSVRPVCP